MTTAAAKAGKVVYTSILYSLLKYSLVMLLCCQQGDGHGTVRVDNLTM